MSAKSYDHITNYEKFEIIGDTVLKLLASI